MANSYTQIYIQAIFVVKSRKNLIHKSWKEPLHKYINGILQKNNQMVFIINGVEDHVHIFFGLNPNQSLSELMQRVKQGSSFWINENKLCSQKFSWQPGYTAFSYSKSHIPNVIRYIKNQEIHHKKVTFLKEYKALLDKYEIDYNPKYLFKDVFKI
jgi:REP element-mobilizing transposase RayT